MSATRYRPVGAFLAGALLSTGASPASAQPATPSRQEQVEQRGMAVMPFDPAKTMHMFHPTLSGGMEAVMAKDGDPKQIDLIRSHLLMEAQKFARGDYSDPTAIHGAQMPGLAALRAAGPAIVIRYEDMQDGGRIVFATHDPSILAAIHEWFAAQASDHGSHAMLMK